jgi:hypothetical protein
MRRGTRRRVRVLAGCAVLGIAVAACSTPGTVEPVGSDAVSRTPSPTASTTGGPSYDAVPPEPLQGPLLTADLLITGSATLPAALRRRVRAVRGVAAVTPLSIASLSANGRTLTVAAGDPADFRRFTPVQSAQADDVWARVAGGEVAVDPSVGKRLEQPRGYLTLGNQRGAPRVHIGAYAPLVRQVSAFVDRRRARQLGLPDDNALLVSTGALTPSALTGRLRKAVGEAATLRVLALEFDVDVPQTAVLGGSVADAVGSFAYTPHADGRVTPDPSWVRDFIRTEPVPILGDVTCNRVMLPQLRAALTEVVQRGLGDRIHRSQYGGCYYPRYIGYDPGKGLSLHTWGIAVDLNVPENQRGTVGHMDRQVVEVFERWGFAWGGHWRYTDPMHFELAALVSVR